MNSKDLTIEYYNNEANKFFENTVSVDFSRIQDLFLQRVKPGDRILDLGCGSGRDSRAFLECGYKVVAVDGSKELAKIAGEYIGQDVIVEDFREYEPEGTFAKRGYCVGDAEDGASFGRKWLLLCLV